MRKRKFKYKFDQNYNPKYINGAIGGVNSIGEIIINFYLERNSLPKSQTYDVTEAGGGKLIETDPEDLNDTSVRFVENGIVMNYKIAKEIHRWLGEHIKQLENLEDNK